ncbi:hypothetical protein KSF_086170 [Reticulibacter mediterranei]|uniref:Uncharacterized protein n=1 Tax=Reticulibacter mediterranei TaxID=2778369 RepID=A0A8J3IVE7_9CHLR|nr:hypothetical protein [Reticulibacter mediterranei]GHO98569.1 hypothetical protein KSF_086170 [Reticulibacter mediterranei]
MADTSEMTNIFRFMELRAPYSLPGKVSRQNYIRDDVVSLRDEKPCRLDADLQSAESPSAIGKLVYEHVFCKRRAEGFETDLDYLLADIFQLLTPYQPLCSGLSPVGGEHAEARPLSIFELERRAYISYGNVYLLLPEQLEQIEGLKLSPQLLRALIIMERVGGSFNLPKLVKELENVFDKRPLQDVVFQRGVYTEDFRTTKRLLFDTLYLLYILRRVVSVNLEYMMDGLRVLHVLETLAVDSLIGKVKAGSLDRLQKALLESLYPEITDWNGSDTLSGLPLIQTETDFHACLTATPIIHPIFARLHWYKHPFNDLKPIGIGDLKVVKQWLIAYQAGEIAHVENVLKGEIKDRTYRHLEKTEETFSFSSDSTQESQKDTQTTDRFELKREVENIVKTELSVGANANVTYNYNSGAVIANVGANFSYKQDATDQTKLSNTFSREILAKAMERVQTRTTEQRSVTKIFETEETDKHGFNNVEGKGHVSGIYRWLDKKYKAQLFNYGKRMMFEFLIPEPAAFFIESRLCAFEATLDVPQPPEKPVPETFSLDFKPDEINETKFQELQQKYDLAEFSFPERTRSVAFINPVTGEDFFQERGIDGNGLWYAKTYTCRLNAKSYVLSKLTITGYMQYQGRNETDPKELNTLEVYIAGNQAVREQNEAAEWWQWNPGMEFSPGNTILFDSDDVALTIGFWDIGLYNLSFYAELVLGQQAYHNWQTQVFNKIRTIEQQRVDKINQEKQLAYNTEMATYRNRRDELKATSVNELLQGQSEAFNSEIIRTELKKHCLTMLTKEFAGPSDALIEKIDALQPIDDHFTFHQFQIKEELELDPPKTTFSISEANEAITYPAIIQDKAREKGRYIQFLEQAFEWQQLAYIFYPYFWARRPKWIEIMNHVDDTDPNMAAFLQAGSVKVLIAVTPAYECAVQHFLATREPWEGGPTPVIGDPLFIPLYEEVRKRQDDLYNAIPEGEPWTFVLPTSLIYLENSSTTLPTFPDHTA